jgi:hypothetical protein
MVVKALRHHFSFSCLLFRLLFLFLTNDMTPPPPPPLPCAHPMTPVLHAQNPSFSPSFSKKNLPFSLQMKLLPPRCFHHWDHKGKYVQWHSLTTVNV